MKAKGNKMSIWKTQDQKPEKEPIIIRCANGAIISSPGGLWGHNVRDGDRWAYLHEVVAQANKAERLQKVVDLAVGALKRINEIYEEYYKGDDEHDSCDWLNCADDMDDLATDTIDEIKQLTKEQ